MPQRTLELGDPYHCQCMKSARLLGEKLQRDEMRIVTTFQSRFGPAKWLEPATDDTLIKEAESGTKRVVVAAPGFAADCVETLEELAIAGREQFTEAGGRGLRRAQLPQHLGRGHGHARGHHQARAFRLVIGGWI